MIMRLMPTSDVHPHLDSWHPAGTGVCLNLFSEDVLALIFCSSKYHYFIWTRKSNSRICGRKNLISFFSFIKYIIVTPPH